MLHQMVFEVLQSLGPRLALESQLESLEAHPFIQVETMSLGLNERTKQMDNNLLVVDETALLRALVELAVFSNLDEPIKNTYTLEYLTFRDAAGFTREKFFNVLESPELRFNDLVVFFYELQELAKDTKYKQVANNFFNVTANEIETLKNKNTVSKPFQTLVETLIANESPLKRLLLPTKEPNEAEEEPKRPVEPKIQESMAKRFRSIVPEGVELPLQFLPINRLPYPKQELQQVAPIVPRFQPLRPLGPEEPREPIFPIAPPFQTQGLVLAEDAAPFNVAPAPFLGPLQPRIPAIRFGTQPGNIPLQPFQFRNILDAVPAVPAKVEPKEPMKPEPIKLEAEEPIKPESKVETKEPVRFEMRREPQEKESRYVQTETKCVAKASDVAALLERASKEALAASQDVQRYDVHVYASTQLANAASELQRGCSSLPKETQVVGFEQGPSQQAPQPFVAPLELAPEIVEKRSRRQFALKPVMVKPFQFQPLKMRKERVIDARFLQPF